MKRARVRGYLADLEERFHVVPMGEHARHLEGRSLPERAPAFPAAADGVPA